jgi:hypothetical protein
MPGRPLYLEILLICFAAILLEVSYTRIFSFKLVYYFTYLIIGLAMLGLGSASVLVALAPRLRSTAASHLVPLCCLVVGASVLGGYLLIARTQLNAFQLIESLWPLAVPVVLREGSKLVLVCLCVFTPFFAAGLAIAGIFATQVQVFSRLYFADLLGAGLACALVTPAISWLSPPGCVLLAGLVTTAAGVRPAARHARALLLPMAIVAVGLGLGVAAPGRLPDPVPDRVKGLGPKAGPLPPTLFSRWSPVFRVDVLPSPLSEARRSIFHDGMMGSVLNRFDGDVASLGRFDADERAYPFRLLRPEPRVAIIGAAGGNEILASLYFRAAHVTAVELNPVTVSLLTTHFADYSGRLAEHPRVTLVNGEGRSFLRRDGGTYDLVWFVAPDSYAAMNAATSGAYVLSESYLYTREMILDSLAHLADDGIVCAQFGEVDFEKKPNRTSRYLATARDALGRLGIHDFGRHVLVATTPGVFTTSTILVRKTPFDDADVQRFVAALVAAGSTVRWVPARPDLVDSPIGKIIALPDDALATWLDASFYDLRPVTDDAPFFWHFVGFRNALGRLRDAEVAARLEEASGERLLLLFLVVATVFAAVALLLPLAARRALWRDVPGKLSAGVYFAAIGTGFMFLEITLIQRLTLFLGYPTYSLTVTLFALLIATGVGSLLSERYGSRDRALVRLAVALGALVLFYRFGLAPLTAAAGGLPFAGRVGIAVLVLAPLGLCLGGFMPLGLRTVTAVTPHREEFVAWSWAVNGFFSVVSSVLATVLAMAYGFDAVMLVALVVYLIGIVALLRLPPPSPC